MRARSLTTLVLAAATAVASTGAAAAAAPTAPASWSTASRSVTRAPVPPPAVTGIRVGHHATFDRVVIDLRGKPSGYKVRYVRTLRADASGRPVDLRGPASLRIVLTPANGHDVATGASTLTTPRRTRWLLDEVRESAVLGDFEAVFTVGVGLARKAPFRVRTLRNPTRIVVDIRH